MPGRTTLDEQEAKELYDTFHVAGSGISLAQMGNANLNPWTEAKVDTLNPDRGPVLIIEGEKDHTVPWAIAERRLQAAEAQPRRDGDREDAEPRPLPHDRPRLARGRRDRAHVRQAGSPKPSLPVDAEALPALPSRSAIRTSASRSSRGALINSGGGVANIASMRRNVSRPVSVTSRILTRRSVWRGLADNLSARFKPIDDVGHPGRVDPEAGCELVRGTRWRLANGPEELGHDPAQTHRFDLAADGLEAMLPVVHQKTPRPSRELLAVILLFHRHSLAGDYH